MATGASATRGGRTITLGAFLKANGFELVDLRWVLKRRSVHVFSKGQRDKICDELAGVADVHVGIFKCHTI
jgi:hypothetical protein